MKRFPLIMLALVSVPALAAEKPVCSVSAVRSTDVSGNVVQVENFGNAFAVRDDLLVTGDHVLVPNAQTVELIVDFADGSKEPIQKMTGTVAARDFHSDLALIRVFTERELVPCKFSRETPQIGDRASVFGFRWAAGAPTGYPAVVKENVSQELAVPAYRDALVLRLDFAADSLSGGAVFLNSQVIGMLDARDQNGVLGLAPIAVDIEREMDNLVRGLQDVPAGTVYRPARNYVYDYEHNSLEFSGLEVIGADQLPNPEGPQIAGEGTVHGRVGGPSSSDGTQVAGEGTVHGAQNTQVAGEGTPHGFVGNRNRSDLYGERYDNVPVAGQRANRGYVLARILPNGAEALRAHSVELADLVASTQSEVVAIYAIDGQPTHNVIELERALANAGANYQLTGVTTQSVSSSAGGESPFQQSIRDANNLLTAVEAYTTAPEQQESLGKQVARNGPEGLP